MQSVDFVLHRCRRRHAGRAAQVMDGGAVGAGEETQAEAGAAVGADGKHGPAARAAPVLPGERVQHGLLHRRHVPGHRACPARRAASRAPAAARATHHAPLP